MSKSSTTIRGSSSIRHRKPIHPGLILNQDLEDANISINHLARAIHVPPNRLSRIVRGERGISADTALRLAAFWGTSARYWMNLQTLYELDVAQAKNPNIGRQVSAFGKAG